jgi:hypothetical protein
MGVVMLTVASVMIANPDVKFENQIARHPSRRSSTRQPDRVEPERLRGPRQPAWEPGFHQGGAAQAAAGSGCPLCSGPDFTGTRCGSTRVVTGRSARRRVWCWSTSPHSHQLHRLCPYRVLVSSTAGTIHVVGATRRVPVREEASTVQRAIGDDGSHLSGRPGQRRRHLTAYYNQYWPADYPIDAQGRVRPCTSRGSGRQREGSEPAARRAALGGSKNVRSQTPDPRSTPSPTWAQRGRSGPRTPDPPGTQS